MRLPGLAACLACAVAVAAPADAKRTLAQLTPTFNDRDRVASGTPPQPIGCNIGFALADARASLEIAGVIGQRGVLAPTDALAWSRAVLGELPVRGIAPDFAVAAS